MKRIIFVLLFSFIILISTLFIPHTVSSQEEMKSVKFGYPLSFVNQELWYYPPSFPRKYSFDFYPLEKPTKIFWDKFFLSYIIIFIPAFLLINYFEIVKTKKSTFNEIVENRMNK